MRVGRFAIKPRVTLADMDYAERLLIAARSSRKEADVRYYIREIFRLLTDAKTVFRWEYKLLEKVLSAAGFQAGAEAKEGEENGIINLTSWIAAQAGGMTPQMVAESMTPVEITPFTKALARQVLENSLRLLRIQHAPKEYSEELQESFRKLETPGERARKTQPVKQVTDLLKKRFSA